jgi:hypothetical protein
MPATLRPEVAALLGPLVDERARNGLKRGKAGVMQIVQTLREVTSEDAKPLKMSGRAALRKITKAAVEVS